MSRERRVKRVALGCGASIALLAAGAMAVLAWLLRDPRPRFAERRSSLVVVDAAQPEIERGVRFQDARLVAASGLTVRLTTRRELADSGKRLPVLVVLGGHVTGAQAARLVGPAAGVLVAAVSYPYDGEPRPSSVTFLRQVPKIRGAFLDTPPAILLALDYLTSLPDADTSRIEGIGVSLGAPFMTIAGSLDQRFSRVWAIHGAAGSYGPLEASMRRTVPFTPLRVIAAGLAAVIINGPRLAPEHWAAGIAPRPFIMINAREDERMSRDAVERLFQSAKPPRELIWTTGGHIHGDAPTIERLTRIVLDRVNADDSAGQRGSSERPRNP